MKTNLKLIIVAGARPNFMKVAPLVKAIALHNKSDGASIHLDCLLVHTGQHYDIQMSEVFFRELDLPRPDINLGIGSGSHAVQTAKIMIRFEEVCLREEPDWVIVVGDVNSTMACAIVAAKLGIKIGHVEAGLRSFDRTMPEEINRIVTDSLADLLFTPSRDADDNLLREGVPPERIKFVGNIMIDTLTDQLEKARLQKTSERYDLQDKNYVLVTLHRPSNIDNHESLLSIMKTLKVISRSVSVIFPVHPRTRKHLSMLGFEEQVGNSGNMKLVEPLGYHDFVSLMEKARLVITDSGGVQEETTFLNIPCLTLRPNTERPITITQGTNKLTALGNIKEDILGILSGKLDIEMAPELWDGMTGKRIIEIISRYA